MGQDFGEITGLLCKKAKNVTSVEFSKARGEAIARRHINEKNLEVIVGDLEKIQFENKKFDIITLIGILEYAPEILEKSENPYSDFIKICKNFLKENGKIIIAVDNRFGMKFFAGAKSEIYDSVFQSITLANNGKKKIFSRKELIGILEENNIENYKFYYPLPDYKIPNVIFSENRLPFSENVKSLYDAYYIDGSKVVFSEVQALKEAMNNGEFETFANSFLVECAIGNNNLCSDIDFISFNNSRKDEYNLELTLNNKNVYKRAIFEDSKEHLKNIGKNIENLRKLGFNIIDNFDNEEEKIVSEYQNTPSFDLFLVEILKTNGTEAFFEMIEKWYREIFKKLSTRHF